MKDINLTTYEKALLELLRAAIHDCAPATECFAAATPDDWKKCCRLATRNGVLIMAWDAVTRLPEEMQPPSAIKIQWALTVEKYEQKYSHYCSTVCKLSELYKQHGISTIVLKGVGVSTYYPVPSHREGGDIDIYTYADDSVAMNNKEANDLANKLVRDRGIEVDCDHSDKHSIFFINGIPFENHRTFIDIDSHRLAPLVERLLSENIAPEWVELLPGQKVLIPSPRFNTLFLAFHAMQHVDAGLALHHLCDWACLIKKYGVNLPKEITDRHILNGVNAFTQICNRYFGTSAPIEGNEKLGIKMLEEILRPFSEREKPGTLYGLIRYKLKEYSYIIPFRNSFLHTPLWRNTEFWGNVSRPILHKMSQLWKLLTRRGYFF